MASRAHSVRMESPPSLLFCGNDICSIITDIVAKRGHMMTVLFYYCNKKRGTGSSTLGVILDHRASLRVRTFRVLAIPAALCC